MLSFVKRFFVALGISVIYTSVASAIETKGVVVTIKPLHSMVSGVMGTTGKPNLLVTGYASPHGFQLKPSQVKLLKRSDIIFSIDEFLETFLQRAFSNIPGNVKQVTVVDAARIKLLPIREGGPWEVHKHDEHKDGEHKAKGDKHTAHKDEGHDYHGGNGDIHGWLTPKNAEKIVKAITRELSELYPENRNIYKANALSYIQKLQKLDDELKTLLVDVKAKPFIVFHDAFQYFEKAYGLNGVGTISIEPDESPSPKRLTEIRKKLKETKTSCVFKEPQFSERVVRAVVDKTSAKIGVLDPLGANLKSGQSMYFELIRKLANNFKQCLTL